MKKTRQDRILSLIEEQDIETQTATAGGVFRNTGHGVPGHQVIAAYENAKTRQDGLPEPFKGVSGERFGEICPGYAGWHGIHGGGR